MAGKKRNEIKIIKSQAIVELAILGSILLVVFNMMIISGQRLDGIQKIKMDAFRKAVRTAFYKNSGVSYTVKEDGRSVDLFSGFGMGQPATYSSSASVMWQKGSPGSMFSENETSFAFYEANSNIIGDKKDGLPRVEKTITTQSGKETTTWVPASVWKEESVRRVNYAVDGDMDLNNANVTVAGGKGIRNYKKSSFGENVITKIYTRHDTTETDDSKKPWEQPEPIYANSTNYTISQGAYINSQNRVSYANDKVGNVIEREREWQTPNK